MLQVNVQVSQNGRLNIRCVINSASLGRGDYVSVILENLYNAPPKVAWARREDVIVLEQDIHGDELNALLSVYLKERLQNHVIVEFDNRGIQETISFRNEVLATA